MRRFKVYRVPALGVLCASLGAMLTIWNEVDAVRRHRQRHRLRDHLVVAEAASVDPLHEGRPVFLRGHTSTLAPLEDPEFQVRFNAIHLRRRVERLQWTEDLRPDGRAVYRKIWSDRRVDSSDFQQPDAHANPRTSIPHGPWNTTAREVTVGSYRLSPDLVRRLRYDEPALPDTVTPPRGWFISGRTLLQSATPLDPQVGDLRVRFDIVPTGPVTLLARQQEDRLLPLRGLPEDVAAARPGHHPPEALLPPPPPPPLLRDNVPRALAFALLTAAGILLRTPFGTLLSPAILPLPRSLHPPALAAALQLLLSALVWLPRAPVPALLLLMALAALFARIGWILRSRREPAKSPPVAP